MIPIVPLNRSYILFNIILLKSLIYKRYFQGLNLYAKEEKSKESFNFIYFFCGATATLGVKRPHF